MRPKYLTRLSEMHAEVVRTEQESGLLLEAAEVLEREVAEHASEKERMQKMMGMSGALDTAYGGAGGEVVEDSMAAGAAEDSSGANFSSTLRGEFYDTDAAGADASRDVRRFRSPGIENYTPTPGGGAFARAGPTPASLKKGSAAKPRQLSIKQLLEYLHAIYDSKVKYDKKCKDAHLPRETMEQHMYTFLNQRYGLRKIIVNQASA